MANYSVQMHGPRFNREFTFRVLRDFRGLFIDNTGYSAMPLAAARKLCDKMNVGEDVLIQLDDRTFGQLFIALPTTDFEVTSVIRLEYAA